MSSLQSRNHASAARCSAIAGFAGRLSAASGNAATSAKSETETTSASTVAGAGCGGRSMAMSCAALGLCSTEKGSGSAGVARRAAQQLRQPTSVQAHTSMRAPRCSESSRDITCPRLGSLKWARPKRSPDLDAKHSAASVRMPQVASCCCALRTECASARGRNKRRALEAHRSSRAALVASFSSSAAVSAFAAASAASTGLSAATRNADQERPFSSLNTAARRAPSFSATKHMSSYARCCGACGVSARRHERRADEPVRKRRRSATRAHAEGQSSPLDRRPRPRQSAAGGNETARCTR